MPTTLRILMLSSLLLFGSGSAPTFAEEASDLVNFEELADVSADKDSRTKLQKCVAFGNFTTLRINNIPENPSFGFEVFGTIWVKGNGPARAYNVVTTYRKGDLTNAPQTVCSKSEGERTDPNANGWTNVGCLDFEVSGDLEVKTVLTGNADVHGEANGNRLCVRLIRL